MECSIDDRALEALLRVAVAGDWEMNLAELLGCRLQVGAIVLCCRGPISLGGTRRGAPISIASVAAIPIDAVPILMISVPRGF